jgi:hypothetical protein
MACIEKHLLKTILHDVITLTLDQQEDVIVECRLTLQISFVYYQHVDRHCFFNLKPELRGFPSKGEFQPDRPINLTATLRPDFLHYLADYPTSEAATTYLQTLQEIQPDHPLRDPNNWYALEVSQTFDNGETTGYRTLWSYLNPAELAAENPSSEVVSAKFTEFLKDSFNFDDLPLDDLAITPQLDRLTQSLTDSLENLWQDSEGELTEALTAITSAFDEIVDSLDELTEAEDSSAGIYSALIDFFTQDDWTFSKIPGELALQIPYQGQNATWNCYAKAREEQQQFIFYSISPIAAPEDKRMAIAHFLTLANYGTLIGNFELDFNDGEIRYKTSIDVEGDRLTPALIKRLVYTNVAMMDEYLPGIEAVLAGEKPEQAIRLVEPSEPIPSDQPSRLE